MGERTPFHRRQQPIGEEKGHDGGAGEEGMETPRERDTTVRGGRKGQREGRRERRERREGVWKIMMNGEKTSTSQIKYIYNQLTKTYITKAFLANAN